MAKVNWGIGASEVDEFDRSKQFKPYDGPVPVNGVYHWRIKVLRSVAATRENLPQLRVGLELVPRDTRKGERRYGGYFIMNFIPVSDKMMWKLVPFLDAIGVTGRDFAGRTITDEEGNIKKIGGYRQTGDFIVAAELRDGTDKDGNPRKEIGWMGTAEEDEFDDTEEDDEEESEEDGDDDFEDDEDGEEWDEDEDGF